MNYWGLSDGFWGALIGAVITGYSAVWVMRRQIKYNLIISRKESLNKRYKDYEVCINNIDLIIMYVESILVSYKSVKITLYESNEYAKKEVVTIVEQLNEILDRLSHCDFYNFDKQGFDLYKKFQFENIKNIAILKIQTLSYSDEVTRKIERVIEDYKKIKKEFQKLLK